MHVLAGGAEQQGDVVQAFRVGQVGAASVEGELPGVSVASEHVGGCEALTGAAAQLAPGGGAEPFVHLDGGGEVLRRLVEVALRGGEPAEEVIDGAVVGGAATDDDVGAGVRRELVVQPFLL